MQSVTIETIRVLQVSTVFLNFFERPWNIFNLIYRLATYLPPKNICTSQSYTYVIDIYDCVLQGILFIVLCTLIHVMKTFFFKLCSMRLLIFFLNLTCQNGRLLICSNSEIVKTRRNDLFWHSSHFLSSLYESINFCFII